MSNGGMSDGGSGESSGTATESGSSSAPASSGPSGDSGGSKAAPATVATTGGLTDGAVPSTSLFEALGGFADDGAPELLQPSPAPQAQQSQPSQQPPTAQPSAAPAAQQTQQPQAQDGTEPQPALEPPAPPEPGPQVASPWSDETIGQLNDPNNRQQLIAQLAEQFSFSPEDITGLATDAAPVLQKFAARIVYDCGLHTLKMLQQFRQSLPSEFAAYSSESEEYSSHEKSFFELWPHLKGGKYDEAIQQVSATVTKIPNITQDGVYQAVGRAVSAMFGLPTAPAGQSAPAPSGQPQRSFSQPAPFTPAAPGARPPVNSAPNGHDNSAPFLGLGLDFD